MSTRTDQPSSKRLVWTLVGIGILVSLVIAGAVSFFASSEPDGLEKVAEDTGFIDDAVDNANAELPLADYGDAGGIPVGVAGIIGVVLTIGVAFGLFWLLGRRKAGDS